ncbi:MAG: EVE domain-containing protein [Paracoccaceae bacterium]
MAGYYIGVAHRAQVAHAAQEGFVAFSHGRESAVQRLNPGDRVIFYAPKSEFDGEPVQAFVAHATVTGEAPCQRAFMGAEGLSWARDAVFDPVGEVGVRPLIDELGFVKDKAHWGMAFRQGGFKISREDYERIARAMLGREP